ncbi:MAG: glycosyltransferase family 4 protein [Gemmataceae bacterium]
MSPRGSTESAGLNLYDTGPAVPADRVGSRRRLDVVHFVQRYPPALGGSEAYFQRLSRYLADRGHGVSVWTTTAIDLEAFWSRRGRTLAADTSDDAGVRVRRFAPLRFPLRRYALKALSLLPGNTWRAMTMPCNPLALDMWREAGCYVGPCDVVHATAFPYAWPIVCARRLARRRGVPFVLTPFLHLGAPDDERDRTRRRYLSAHLRELLHSADRVFVQTPTERDAVLELGVPPEDVVLQGMGVNPAECTGGDRLRARRSWGMGADELVIGHLANLSHEKGSIDLLEAARRLWEEGLKFRIVLAGPQMTNYRRYRATHEFQNLTETGVLNDQQKRDFFAGIDVFALPSRSDSFGLVLLEAWANGVPSVAYRAGGVADVIRHERDGLLAKCGDIAELAAYLRRLLDDSKTRSELGAAGRARIAREFRWADKLALVERTYAELVQPTVG